MFEGTKKLAITLPYQIHTKKIVDCFGIFSISLATPLGYYYLVISRFLFWEKNSKILKSYLNAGDI